MPLHGSPPEEPPPARGAPASGSGLLCRAEPQPGTLAHVQPDLAVLPKIFQKLQLEKVSPCVSPYKGREWPWVREGAGLSPQGRLPGFPRVCGGRDDAWLGPDCGLFWPLTTSSLLVLYFQHLGARMGLRDY